MKGGLLAQAVAPPNLVTYVRIAVIPFVMYLMLDDSPRNAFIAAMFFCLVSATDFLDGYLARRDQVVPAFGRIDALGGRGRDPLDCLRVWRFQVQWDESGQMAPRRSGRLPCRDFIPGIPSGKSAFQ